MLLLTVQALIIGFIFLLALEIVMRLGGVYSYDAVYKRPFLAVIITVLYFIAKELAWMHPILSAVFSFASLVVLYAGFVYFYFVLNISLRKTIFLSVALLLSFFIMKLVVMMIVVRLTGIPLLDILL